MDRWRDGRDYPLHTFSAVKRIFPYYNDFSNFIVGTLFETFTYLAVQCSESQQLLLECLSVCPFITLVSHA